MAIQTEKLFHAEIAAANDMFMKHFEKQDAVALAELYTEQAQLLPPNGDFVTGKPAIQAFWQALFEMGISKAILEIVEVEQCGDTAVEVSRFKMFNPDNQILDEGKYIVIWKQRGHQWKLHRDIFNSSVPSLD